MCTASGAPKPAQWAKNGKGLLLEDAVGLGERWKGLVVLWWKLEESTRFATSIKSHPPRYRPKQVAVWVKNARKGTPALEVKTFSAQWWVWWRAINPDWRQGEGEGELLKGVEGSWGVMECPGQNGFLNILICLKWWGERLDSDSREEWERAVDDVNWVLRGMLR
ncbi:hypothetical protein B0H11DRAFT_1765718 [Mycena galericulata]|nr:hypothetical protein B0H11DRAFT_1765718 [Mycena galericulata]